MKVRLHEPTFGEDEIAAAVEVLRSTQVTSGAKVIEFESCFGPNYAVMVNSGSSANLLAVSALCNPMMDSGLQEGDEVIVSALSWSTTVWPLVQNGLLPKIVDIDLDTLNIDPDKVEQAIGPNTRAIMPVNVYGNLCDVKRLKDLCRRYGLWYIEDCCEALDVANIRSASPSSDIQTYSFYFSHHITTLEGGMVVTGNNKINDLLRILRSHGWIRDLPDAREYVKQYPDIDPRFLFVNVGYNLRSTEVAAAIGLVQLPKLAGFIEARRKAADMLLERFKRYEHYLSTQKETSDSRSTWFGFPIVVKDNAPFTSGDIRKHFEENEIETRSIICGNIARQPGMQLFSHVKVGRLKNADHVMKNGFSIGCHQDIGIEICSYVGDILDDFMRSGGYN